MNRAVFDRAEPLQLLLIHERIGNWVRHVRPRMAEPSLRIVETRSGSDILTAVETIPDPYPLALIDLGRRTVDALDELRILKERAPGALVLVIDSDAAEDVPTRDDVALTANRLGATHVVQGPATPLEVVRVLSLWKTLARQRRLKAGWSAPFSSPESAESEPWNWISTIIGR